MNPLKPLLKPYKKLLQKQNKLTKYRIYSPSPQYHSCDGVCDCVGSDGSIKDWYHSRDIAYQVSKRYEREFKIRLDIYQCPLTTGWHLTKV